MGLNSKIEKLPDSATLKLNSQVGELQSKGEKIFNLTAGQLPLKPHPDFIININTQTNFLKSFQYSPVDGDKELQQKLFNYMAQKRKVEFDENFKILISNGGKHSLYNILGAILNPGDEVILLAPYWLSYPAMVSLWGGECKVVEGLLFENFQPPLEKIKKLIGPKTKAIILNSPNNPSGVHYDDEWMKGFAEIIKENPSLYVLSDEIYRDLFFYDPAPKHFYQYAPQLLNQCIIFEGISKTLACTGLRLGFCIGPKEVMNLAQKIQAQTTSGANSLIQKALLQFPLEKIDEFLKPIKIHLRENVKILRELMDEYQLNSAWYQPRSAFYFMLDFTAIKHFNVDKNIDQSGEICKSILQETNVAVVPCSDFGVKNAARISLVSESEQFKEAIVRLFQYLQDNYIKRP